MLEHVQLTSIVYCSPLCHAHGRREHPVAEPLVFDDTKTSSVFYDMKTSSVFYDMKTSSVFYDMKDIRKGK